MANTGNSDFNTNIDICSTDPSNNKINRVISDFKLVSSHLLDNNEFSHELAISEFFRKYFLISCASLFEKQIQEIIITLVSSNTVSLPIQNMVKSKVIERQYHTYFSWKDKNANQFYALFGSEFKKRILSIMNSDRTLKQAEQDFLEIGAERNLLVHENFLDYPLNKSPDDILTLYKSASLYIDLLRRELV